MYQSGCRITVPVSGCCEPETWTALTTSAVKFCARIVSQRLRICGGKADVESESESRIRDECRASQSERTGESDQQSNATRKEKATDIGK